MPCEDWLLYLFCFIIKFPLWVPKKKKIKEKKKKKEHFLSWYLGNGTLYMKTTWIQIAIAQPLIESYEHMFQFYNQSLSCRLAVSYSLLDLSYGWNLLFLQNAVYSLMMIETPLSSIFAFLCIFTMFLNEFASTAIFLQYNFDTGLIICRWIWWCTG